MAHYFWAAKANCKLPTDDVGTFVIPRFDMRLDAQAVLELYISADGFARTLAMRKTISEGTISSSD